jgi:transcriptional regulator GlxA family with amidase domain
MSIPKKGSEGANTTPKESKYPEGSAIPEQGIRHPRVKIVIDVMNANLQRRISLTELAGAANLSRSHLCRLFKTQTGLSQGEYLRRLRMGKARDLLAASVLSIKEVMAAVGYDSKSHFSRQFRRSFGLAPSEYRKKLST